MILTILKVIGIILLVILGILVCILFMVLGIPIRYQFDGKYDEKADLDAKVSWLPVLLKATVSFHDNKLRYIVKLFGGVIMTNTDARLSFLGRKLFSDTQPEADAGRKKTPDRERTTKEDMPLASEDVRKEDRTPASFRMEEDARTDDLEETAVQKKQKKESLFTRLKKKIADIRRKIRHFIESLKTINEKREDLQKVYHSKRFEIARKDVILYIKRLFHILKPDKLNGRLHFGLKDPASTGELSGVLAMFLPLYDGYFTIQPEFEYACLDGNITGRGKFSLCPIVLLAIKVIFNKNLIKVMKRVKTIIER